MKQPEANNQSGISENLHAQTGQAPEAAALNDLPVNEAQAAEIKAGIVTIEYLLLGTVLPQRPAGAVVSRP